VVNYSSLSTHLSDGHSLKLNDANSTPPSPPLFLYPLTPSSIRPSSVKSKQHNNLCKVVEQLHCVLDTIISFCASTDTLFADALAELSRLDQKVSA
jgi:hypothetical protein